MPTILADFTPTEQRIVEKLQEGALCSKLELFKCLPDELSSISALRKHISLIRGKLRPQGLDILIKFQSMTPYYQMVRLLTHDE